VLFLSIENRACNDKKYQVGIQAMTIKTVTRAALVAAVYVVLTVALAPLSFGPLQFRVSEMLKPLALFAPWFA